MKKNIFLSLIIVLSVFIITARDNNANINKPLDENNKGESNNMEIVRNIRVTIDGKMYNAKLEENETVTSFINMLPQELSMKELNGNEKYYYMNVSLPTNASNPKRIEAGDIMLYGNDCLVVFYKSFNTSYSYTKIGHIDNLPDLGNENITIKFER